MSSIIKPVLGSQLNLGHPLATGLVGLWLFNEGSGGQVYDLSGNGYSGSITTPVWGAGKFGMALEHIGTTSYTTGTTLPQPSEQTIVCWATPTSADNGRVWSYGSAERELLIYSSRWNLYGAGYDLYPASAAVGVGRTDCIACVISTSGDYAKLYLNGVLLASDTDIGASSGNTLDIGSDGSNPSFDGYIEAVYSYNRVLSASEVALLHREPFCMFERDPIELWSAATSGAPPVGMAGAMTTNTGYWGW